MTLPEWGRKVLLLAIIPVPREVNQCLDLIVMFYLLHVYAFVSISQ